MKQKLFGRLAAAAVLLLSAATASAHDFEVNGIYYNINSDGTSVSVTDGGYSGEVTIPASVTFSGKTYSVTSIGNAAFYDCSGLTRVDITDIEAWCNITFGNDDSNPLNYAHHLYLNGSEVTNLIIPSTITKINNYAFFGCSGLTAIAIPNSVTSIGTSAFYGCI